MVMVLRKPAPKEEKNDDHDQDFLTKNLLHIWAAAQMIYLNSCQSRFSGVYLVL